MYMSRLPDLSKLSLACQPCAVHLATWSQAPFTQAVLDHPLHRERLQENDCVICQYPLSANSGDPPNVLNVWMLTELPCGHAFHVACLAKSMKYGHANNQPYQCPIDRIEIPNEVAVQILGVLGDAVPGPSLPAPAPDTLPDIDIQLFHASREGNADLVTMLLLSGANINATDSTGFTSLILATDGRATAVVRLLLDSNANVNTETALGTALTGAISIEFMPIVEMLINEPGIDLERADEFGHTALRTAISVDRPDIVRMLIDARDNVNTQDAFGTSPLLATQSLEIMSMLLNANADVNDVAFDDDHHPERDGETRLIAAAQDGAGDFVSLLLGANANVNQARRDGNTALIMASRRGEGGVVNLLLDVKGINVDAENSDGLTALMFASGDGYADVVNSLLSANANANATSAVGGTALMWSSVLGYTNVVTSLLASGANANAANSDGDTALILASRRGYEYVVNLLLNVKGIDVHAANSTGNTALIRASEEGHVNVVQRLLQYSPATVHDANTDGETALMLAREEGHVAVAEILHDAQAWLAHHA